METKSSIAYLRFLGLSNALTGQTVSPLSANQRALLEAIALAWHSGQPMSVRQAISLSSLGSPATLHKRLGVLRTEGYLHEAHVLGNKRTKWLGPTPKALKFFEMLSEAMDTARETQAPT
jgi:hypothetical protein